MRLKRGSSAAIIVIVILALALVGTGFLAFRLYYERYLEPHGGDVELPPENWQEQRYYVKVSGTWDSASGTGSISEISVHQGPLSSKLAVTEGGTIVVVEIRSLSGDLLKTFKQPINDGSWTVYVDVTEYRGKTLKITAKLIDERIGAYGIPQPIMVDQKTTELAIT